MQNEVPPIEYLSMAIDPTFRRSSNQYLRDFRVGQGGGSMAVFSG
jgi:hypothetical protein